MKPSGLVCVSVLLFAPAIHGAAPPAKVAKAVEAPCGISLQLDAGIGVALWGVGSEKPGGRFGGTVGYQLSRRHWSVTPHAWVESLVKTGNNSHAHVDWRRLIVGGGVRLHRWGSSPLNRHVGIWLAADIGWTRESITAGGAIGGLDVAAARQAVAFKVSFGGTWMVARTIGMGPQIDLTKTTSDEPGLLGFSWTVKGFLPM